MNRNMRIVHIRKSITVFQSHSGNEVSVCNWWLYTVSARLWRIALRLYLKSVQSGSKLCRTWCLLYKMKLTFIIGFSDLAFWQILSTIGLFLTYRTDSTDYLTISGFTSLNGLTCLHSVLDKAGSQSVFERTSNPRIFIHVCYRLKTHKSRANAATNDRFQSLTIIGSRKAPLWTSSVGEARRILMA